MADTAKHGQGPAWLAQSLAWYALETHEHRRKPWTRWKGGGLGLNKRYKASFHTWVLEPAHCCQPLVTRYRLLKSRTAATASLVATVHSCGTSACVPVGLRTHKTYMRDSRWKIKSERRHGHVLSPPHPIFTMLIVGRGLAHIAAL